MSIQKASCAVKRAGRPWEGGSDMKIVVLDGYTENPGDLSWEELGRQGELTVYDRTPITDEGEIISRIGEAEVMGVRS